MSAPRLDENRTQRLAALTGLTLAAGCAVGGYYYWRAQTQAQTYSATGFDVNQVEAAPQQTYTYTPPPKAAPAASPAPLVGGVKVSFNGQAPAAPKFEKTGPSAEELKREQEWLKRWGGPLRQYVYRLGRITTRFYKSSPVVRDVDRSFGAMPRYMEVKRRHSADGNPFAFVREAVALPEVRAEIRRRMADPRVWRESVLMMLEAVKEQPPPGPIYSEVKRFMTKDPAMVDYLPEFTGEVTNNVGTAMRGIPREANLDPLRKVIQDVSPNSLPQAAPQASAPRR